MQPTGVSATGAGPRSGPTIFQFIRHVVTELTIGRTLAARLAVGAVTLVGGPPEDSQTVFTPTRV
jgi:hypothetical protein